MMSGETPEQFVKRAERRVWVEYLRGRVDALYGELKIALKIDEADDDDINAEPDITKKLELIAEVDEKDDAKPNLMEQIRLAKLELEAAIKNEIEELGGK